MEKQGPGIRSRFFPRVTIRGLVTRERLALRVRGIRTPFPPVDL